MNINVGDTILLTTNDWFYAPNGQQYKAVFGTVKAVLSSEATLGVRTNARSTNWYVEIGDMTVAGCQIFYAVRTPHCNFEDVPDYTQGCEHGVHRYIRPSNIYNADSRKA